jgi:hypothetical protein
MLPTSPVCSQPLRRVSAVAATIAPVAGHHRVATHQDFADFARRQGFVVRAGDADFDAGEGRAHRGQPFQAPRVRGVGMVGARQAGDGHRRFALAVDLHQHIAEARQCRLTVGDVHRSAAIDDGLQAGQGIVVAVLDQALDHGRRGEHRHAAMRA